MGTWRRSGRKHGKVLGLSDMKTQLTDLLMSTSMCSQETTPVTFQACVMTKDCVVSEWSQWTACSKDCYDPNGPKGKRARSRRVSQFPVGGGMACPQLEETEPCSPQGDGVHPCTVYVHQGGDQKSMSEA